MLQGDFFTISNIEISSPDVKAALEINGSHKIFEGHFPGQPVVPGVCMMQMVKEIMELVIEKKLQLSKANEMKFLAVINPQENKNIDASFKYAYSENGSIIVSASFFKEALTYFKFKGEFVLQ